MPTACTVDIGKVRSKRNSGSKMFNLSTNIYLKWTYVSKLLNEGEKNRHVGKAKTKLHHTWPEQILSSKSSE